MFSKAPLQRIIQALCTKSKFMGTPPPPAAAAHPTLQVSMRSLFTEKLLENTGSIARDILATERTFLAWARTGLGFVGAGSALFAAYHRHESVIQEDIVPACAVLLINGSYLLLFATRRYLRVIDAIQNHNKFPVNVGGTLTAVIVTAVGTLSSMALVARAEWKTETNSSKSKKAPAD
jgi:uncharacterized membrane protein YidH (DUF202 family)